MQLNPLSQLPFGFDVDWYLDGSEFKIEYQVCLNCLSALMSIGTVLKVGEETIKQARSQLPFGFDVDWYSIIFGRSSPASGTVSIAFRL